MKFKIILVSQIIFYSFEVLLADTNNTSSNFETSLIGPSPQASEIVKYGEYPVSPATGLPSIDIPIYTIEYDGVKVPISVSYHASGIKVSDIGTTVGIGWALNAGGQISRTICSTYDKVWEDNPFLFQNKDEFQKKLYADNAWKTLPADYICNLSNGKIGDTESDKYFYQFGNKSGNFRYTINGKNIITAPYSTIRIEYYENNKDEENVYKITDDDGTIYYFEHTEHSPSQTESYSPITTWYLSKIITPNKRDSIIFSYIYSEYEQRSESRHLRYGPTANLGVGNSIDISTTFKNQLNESNVYSNYRTPIIKKIEWNGHKIEFSYANDREEAKYIDSHCTSTLQKERLDKICIINRLGDSIKNVVFEKAALGTSGVEGCRTLLKGIKFYGGLMKNSESYSFTYNNNSLPKHTSSTDFWGYYNGDLSLVNWPYKMMDDYKVLNYDGFYGADKHPNEETMQYGVLKSITFPTGGKFVLEYEANRVSVDGNLKVWGGLRVKTIEKYSFDKLVCKEVYTYSPGKTSMPLNMNYAGLWGDEYSTYYCRKNSKGTGCSLYSSPVYCYQCFESPRISMTGWSSNPAFYENVTKKVTDASGNLIKQTDYKYIEDADSRTTQCPMKFFPKYYCALYDYDQGPVQPLLVSQKDYSFVNGVESSCDSTINTYELVSIPDSLVGVHIALSAEIVKLNDCILSGSSVYNVFIRPNCKYMNEYIVPSFRRLKTSINYSDGIETKTTYFYDDLLRTLQPIRQVVTRADNNSHATEYTYPFDSKDNVVQSMYKDHFVDNIIETTEKMNGNVVSRSKNSYVNVNNRYLFSLSQESVGTNKYKDRVKIISYDSFGNIQEFTQDDTTRVILIWGYNQQYPIVKIECGESNSSDVWKTLKTIQKGDNCIPLYLGHVRERLKKNNPNCLVTTYRYKPLVGIIEVIDPSGVLYTYQYDDLGRLAIIKDCNGNIINKYDYHYVE